MLLEKLKVNDEFHDSDIFTEAKFLNDNALVKINFSVIGDHVYTISNNINTLVVAHDLGNGNGKVLSVTHYNM